MELKEILEDLEYYCERAFDAKKAILKYQDSGIKSLLDRRNKELNDYRREIEKLLGYLKPYYILECE